VLSFKASWIDLAYLGGLGFILKNLNQAVLMFGPLAQFVALCTLGKETLGNFYYHLTLL